MEFYRSKGVGTSFRPDFQPDFDHLAPVPSHLYLYILHLTLLAMVATTDLPAHVLDKVRPAQAFSQSNLLIETYLKRDLSLKLDADAQICTLNLTPAGCPLGPELCPLRHTDPSRLNFQPPKPMPSHPRERERLNTVCKHWLRGLCKKVRPLPPSPSSFPYFMSAFRLTRCG